MTTYFAVIRFDADDDFNEDGLLNRIATAIEALGGTNDDEIIGTLLGEPNGSLDDAFGAGKGYLNAQVRR